MHDYYFLTFGTPIIFIPIAFFAHLPKPTKWSKYIVILTSLSIGYVLVANSAYLVRKINGRYAKEIPSLPHPDLNVKATQLRQVGIKSSSPMLVLGDISPNVGLYYLKQPGWTNYFPKNDFISLEEFCQDCDFSIPLPRHLHE